MYIDEFDSIVTTVKRNHIYYGPTESRKVSSTLGEVAVDLDTVFYKVSELGDSVDALSSGMLLASGILALASGVDYNLYDLKSMLYDLESRIDKRIYVQAEQASVLE